MKVPEVLMKVTVDGHSEMREVSHRTEVRLTVLGETGPRSLIREVPVMREGETCVHTLTGECVVYRAKWPDPLYAKLFPRTSLPGTFVEDGDD